MSNPYEESLSSYDSNEGLKSYNSGESKKAGSAAGAGSDSANEGWNNFISPPSVKNRQVPGESVADNPNTFGDTWPGIPESARVKGNEIWGTDPGKSVDEDPNIFGSTWQGIPESARVKAGIDAKDAFQNAFDFYQKYKSLCSLSRKYPDIVAQQIKDQRIAQEAIDEYMVRVEAREVLGAEENSNRGATYIPEISGDELIAGGRPGVDKVIVNHGVQLTGGRMPDGGSLGVHADVSSYVPDINAANVIAGDTDYQGNIFEKWAAARDLSSYESVSELGATLVKNFDYLKNKLNPYFKDTPFELKDTEEYRKAAAERADYVKKLDERIRTKLEKDYEAAGDYPAAAALGRFEGKLGKYIVDALLGPVYSGLTEAAEAAEKGEKELPAFLKGALIHYFTKKLLGGLLGTVGIGSGAGAGKGEVEAATVMAEGLTNYVIKDVLGWTLPTVVEGAAEKRGIPLMSAEDAIRPEYQ